VKVKFEQNTQSSPHMIGVSATQVVYSHVYMIAGKELDVCSQRRNGSRRKCCQTTSEAIGGSDLF